ncbi:hypothetical protein BDF22DRAFT_686862 [Syncephalis plumigaleata]|nr:hypothetical protein BDF22DRAFT_686862 [Syncephalis plumigaleata]
MSFAFYFRILTIDEMSRKGNGVLLQRSRSCHQQQQEQYYYSWRISSQFIASSLSNNNKRDIDVTVNDNLMTIPIMPATIDADRQRASSISSSSTSSTSSDIETRLKTRPRCTKHLSILDRGNEAVSNFCNKLNNDSIYVRMGLIGYNGMEAWRLATTATATATNVPIPCSSHYRLKGKKSKKHRKQLGNESRGKTSMNQPVAEAVAFVISDDDADDGDQFTKRSSVVSHNTKHTKVVVTRGQQTGLSSAATATLTRQSQQLSLEEARMKLRKYGGIDNLLRNDKTSNTIKCTLTPSIAR